jgi:phosphoglycolate phosphatase
MTRLVVFDCDGTLVDSQHLIVAAMTEAFDHNALPAPTPAAVRHVVGLSLVEAVARLLPDGEPVLWQQVAHHYQASWRAMRTKGGVSEPLFDGAREVLDQLVTAGHLLAVATGKSLPGLEMVLDHHGLRERFVSLQTADRNPGKPHPGMLHAAIDEAGCTAAETVMIGDTSYDMEMAIAAGVRPIGVAWGYHPPDQLAATGAVLVLERFTDLPALLAEPTP